MTRQTLLSICPSHHPRPGNKEPNELTDILPAQTIPNIYQQTMNTCSTMPPNLMQTFHPDNIPVAISVFRPDGEVPILNERYMDGGQCRIFKVDFSDGKSWSVRIPIHIQSDSQGSIISILRGEQDVLQNINATDFAWAPKHLGSSFTFENLVGYPFIILSWTEGSPLLWSDNYPPRPVRNKILDQVAKIHVSLIDCTKENSIFNHLSSSANAYVCREERHIIFLENNKWQVRPSTRWPSPFYNRERLL